jgi:CRP-like cAMP-binding protein
MTPSEYFNLFHACSDEDLNELFSMMTAKRYSRGEFVVRPGQVQGELLIVKQGYQMSFVDHDGKTHVIAFTYPPNICAIPESFMFQKPSPYSLQCLTDSEFDAISFNNLNELFERSRTIERLFRKITEAILTGLIQRHIDLHVLSIEERFRSFAARSPQLLHDIPHKYIASYLNIDPTNFSKLFNSVRL